MLVPNNSLRQSLELAASRYESNLNQAEKFLAERKISWEVARHFRLGVVNEPVPGHEGYRGRLAIPYLTPTGVTTMRFRCLRDHICKDVDCPKMLGLPLHEPRLYNVGDLFIDTDLLVIVEGESDTWTVKSLHIPVIGYQGVESWEPYFTKAIGRYPDIIVLADMDDSGQGLAAAKDIAIRVSGRVVECPIGHDPNSTVQTYGPDRLIDLLNGRNR